MDILKRTVRQILRPCGWELRQFNEDISLDTYLWGFFKRYNINCVLDVGARHGEYGVVLRNNNYKGHIISFEPIEENFQQLQRQSKGDALWQTHHYALGSENTTASINVSQGTNLSSFFKTSDYGKQNMPGIDVKRVETVPIRKLDDIFQEVMAHIPEPRIYLKMDTQGWDIEVLRGAKNSLAHILALQSEISLQPLYEGMPDWTTSLHEFQERGFVISSLFPVWRDENKRLSEMDCVMVKCV